MMFMVIFSRFIVKNLTIKVEIPLKMFYYHNSEKFYFFIYGGHKMSSNNQNLAMQRIAKLVDENSFMEIGSLVTARSTDFNLSATKAPSDGVIIGHGLIEGNLVFIYSHDASVLNGTIGEMHAKKIVIKVEVCVLLVV